MQCIINHSFVSFTRYTVFSSAVNQSVAVVDVLVDSVPVWCGVNRLKKGLDAVTGDEVTDDSETDETNAVRSRSFDAAAPGYVAAPGSGSGGGGWLSGFLSSADADVALSLIHI